MLLGVCWDYEESSGITNVKLYLQMLILVILCYKVYINTRFINVLECKYSIIEYNRLQMERDLTKYQCDDK